MFTTLGLVLHSALAHNTDFSPQREEKEGSVYILSRCLRNTQNQTNRDDAFFIHEDKSMTSGESQGNMIQPKEGNEAPRTKTKEMNLYWLSDHSEELSEKNSRL